MLARRGGTDQGTVGDCIRHRALLLHCVEALWGLLWLLALLSGTDQEVVGGNHTLLVPCLENLQGHLWPLALLAGPDQDLIKLFFLGNVYLST